MKLQNIPKLILCTECFNLIIWENQPSNIRNEVFSCVFLNNLKGICFLGQNFDIGLVKETLRRGYCNFASNGYKDKVSDLK